jgi:hypothetical protein
MSSAAPGDPGNAVSETSNTFRRCRDAGAAPMFPGMFALDESDVTAILAAFDRDGEPAAVAELRRRFPGLSENAGLEATRMIVRWRPARDESAKPDR